MYKSNYFDNDIKYMNDITKLMKITSYYNKVITKEKTWVAFAGEFPTLFGLKSMNTEDWWNHPYFSNTAIFFDEVGRKSDRPTVSVVFKGLIAVMESVIHMVGYYETYSPHQFKARGDIYSGFIASYETCMHVYTSLERIDTDLKLCEMKKEDIKKYNELSEKLKKLPKLSRKAFYELGERWGHEYDKEHGLDINDETGTIIQEQISDEKKEQKLERDKKLLAMTRYQKEREVKKLLSAYYRDEDFEVKLGGVSKFGTNYGTKTVSGTTYKVLKDEHDQETLMPKAEYDKLVAAEMKKPSVEEYFKVTPKDIKNYLDKYVIGQSDAKDMLSVAYYRHTRSLIEPSIRRDNVLLIGPSGSGKSELIRTLAKYDKCPMPIYFYDAANITPSGFKGDDISGIIDGLYQFCGNSAKRAENAIVFLDEIDKIIAPNYEAHGTNLSSNIQGQLLAMLEGKTYLIHDDVTINTKNILFICAGAFSDLTKQIAQRKEPNPIGFGFNSELKDEEFDDSNITSNDFTLEDMVSWGMKEELAGRIPNISYLHKLSRDDYRVVLLNENGGPIDKLRKELASENIEVEFTENAISYIIDRAYDSLLGMRAYIAVMSEVSNKIYMDLKKGVRITVDYVNGEITLTDGPLQNKSEVSITEEYYNEYANRMDQFYYGSRAKLRTTNSDGNSMEG